MKYLVFYLLLIINITSFAHSEFTPLNPLLEVGKEIYVQHDSQNNTIYSLKKSGTGSTIVYKIIIPFFEANKVWLKNGSRIDKIDSAPQGATYPDKYIPVNEGEEYFVKLYGVGSAKLNNTYIEYAPILFLDENNKVISAELIATYSKSKSGVTLKVPPKAKKLHITNYNNQGLTVQKVLHLTDKEFDNLPILESKIVPKIESLYKEYVKDPVVYKKLTKAFIIFVNDDTRPDIYQYVDLFIKKSVPFSLATIPEQFIENASNQKETRLDSIKRLIKSGKGEILVHNGGPLTEANLKNYNEMYRTFIRSKQMFNFYGIETHGIILAGGEGQIVSNVEEEKWASAFHSFADNYGLIPGNKDTYKNLCIDSVYYHSRTGLSYFQNDIEKIKAEIDKDILNKNFHVYYFHTYDEIKEDILSQMLDYVKQKEKEGKLHVGSYKEMYEKNAIRYNTLINTKTTYYVSSSGKSEDGLSMNNPMNLDTLAKTKLKSGDRILLKRGDTFYGQISPTFLKVNDQISTISCYGDEELPLPKLSGYKIVKKNESWEKYTGTNLTNIYRLNLTDFTKFDGLKKSDSTINKIGFLEDKNRKKYFNLKSNITDLKEVYDFCGDNTFLYIKTKGNTPYKELGELKLASRINIIIPQSNMKIEKIHIKGTGAHGMVGANPDMENIEICNNIIEDIGGSFLKENTRYGNGIEFYGTNIKNLRIHHNIIRNTYDVGFTIQGPSGSGLNVSVKTNIFCLNSQDSEIWESEKATGVYNYVFEDNISLLQGRGWGYDARPDKIPAAHILFWGYNVPNITEKTKIYFTKNYVYNPRKLYYISDQVGTDVFFKNKTSIRSDYNNYYVNNDTILYRKEYSYETRNEFITKCNKDHHSKFVLLQSVDKDIVSKATNSLDFNELRKIFFAEDESGGSAAAIIIILIIIILGALVGFYFYRRKKTTGSFLEGGLLPK